MVAPVANPLNLSGDEDTEILATLEGTDGDENPLDYEIVDGPTNGIVKLVDDGGVEEYVYIPNADYNGTDSFTYRVFDGTEYSNTATVDITVNSIADVPRISQGLGPAPGAIGGSYEGDQVAVAASVNSGWVEVRHGYNQLGDTDGIYLEVWSAGGVSQNNVRVNTTTTDVQYDPSVALLDDGSFIVTWTSMNQDGDGAGVYMQRMTPAGGTSGSETLVNTTTTGVQDNSDVVGLSDGGWLVTWRQFDGLETHVFAQRYDDSGTTVGGEVQIDTAVGYEAYDPSVARLANGDYVITWETPGHLDGSEQGVFAQHYNSAGVAQGGAFQVNDVTADCQSDPQIAALADGGFVIAFGTGPLGLHTGISVRMFTASHSPRSNDIVVDVGNNNVNNLSVTGLDDGGFAVAWEAERSGFTSSWVQRFDFAGIAVSAPVQVNEASAEQQMAPVAFTHNGDFIVSFVESVDLVGDFSQHQAFALPTKESQLTEGSLGSNLLPQATLLDPDSATLDSLTVQIKGGAWRPGDTLEVDTSGTSISASMTGDTLTLSGSAAVADYQTVLRTLSMKAPDGGSGVRILDIIATAPDGSSMAQQLHLKVATANQAVSGDTTADAVYGGNGADTLNGDDGADTIIGNANNDLLVGGYGQDSLVGGMGNDTLNGGYGVDTLLGGEGSDTYYVNIASDVITETGESGLDVVYASASVTMASGVENLYLTGNAGINGIGNAASNEIEGNNGSNSLEGGSGFDSLVGYGGDDTLNGGFGLDDTLLGCAGNDLYITESGDTIYEAAGAGIDTIQTEASWTLGAHFENLVFTGEGMFQGIGNGSANSMSGNTSANKFEGRGGDDTLAGNGGNDTLDGGAGGDSLLGGTGNDLYIIDSAVDVADETGGGGVDTVRTLVNFTLGAGIENLTMKGLGNLNVAGNASANTMSGNASNNTLIGYAGNDTLFGGGGNDAVDGGLNNDRVYGGDGDDTLYGDEGNDRLWGGNDSDELWGGNGNDTLSGDSGANTLRGGAGDDIYKLFNAGDSVIELAAEGIDTIEVFDSDYTLTAGNVENLTVIGGAESSLTITGSAGNNVITAIEVDIFNSFTILGGGGADTIYGSWAFDDITADGDDYIDASDDDDVVNGTGNYNTIYGGDGNDDLTTFVWFSSIHGGLGDDTIAGDYTNTITGGDGADDIQVNWYSDVDGGIGNDTLTVYGEDYNTLHGGAGADTVQVNSAFTATGNSLYGDAGNDILSDNKFGNAFFGGLDHDTLTSNGSNNSTFQGDEGNDTLTGAGGGSNTFNGGDGDDVLVADGSSFDVYYGGNDNDLLQSTNYASAELYGDAGNDTLIADALDSEATLIGGIGDDLYVLEHAGNFLGQIWENDLEGIDTLEVTDGSFSLSGTYIENLVGHANLATSLVLTGGIEDNTITAITDAGPASFTLLGGDGFDTLNGAGYDDSLNGGVMDDDLYGNNGNDTLDGNVGNDFLEGGNGDDSLTGDMEDDTLRGGDGNDTLIGGAGIDTFVFDWTPNGSTNVDNVDFESGIDLIEIDNNVFTSLTFGPLPGGQFVVGTAAADADDYIVFDDTTGSLYYDADGDGGGNQVKFAQFTGSWVLSNSDISIIGSMA